MVAVVFGTAGLSGTVVAAGREPNCWRSADRGDWGERYCSIEERTIRPGGVIRVDAHPNGGVTIVGTDGNQIQLKAMIQDWDRTDERGPGHR